MDKALTIGMTMDEHPKQSMKTSMTELDVIPVRQVTEDRMQVLLETISVI